MVGIMIKLVVNGRSHDVDAAPDTPLLYVLRNDLGLTGPKFGCGLGQCGACTVLVDGVAIRSCTTPLSSAARGPITTIEGLGTPEKPHPVQQAFIEEQAAQCAYCINGMIMTTAALIARNKQPTREQIRSTLNANLCRCGSHMRIVRAVEKAAALSLAQGNGGSNE
jgi:nicotinate dehydrogenase subunit A